MIEPGSFTLGSLLGIILGAFIGHALTIRREKAKEKRSAGMDLKQALLATIDSVRSGKNASEAIATDFARHNELSIRYSAHLSSSSLKTFSDTFQKYRDWHDVMCNRSAADKMYGQNDPDYIQQSSISVVDLADDLIRSIT